MMGKVSDDWTSLQELDRESEHAQKIDQVLNTADFTYLRLVASRARYDQDLRSNVVTPQSQTSPLTCSIDLSKFAAGNYNVVVELEFPDSSRWIARIRLPDDKSNENDQIETSMLSEIATVRLVASRTSIPVPRIYGFDVDATNQFGFRYILMQALPGCHPDSGLSRSIPRKYWDKLADQLADYWYQLSRLRFNRIGRLWCGRSADEEEPSIIPLLGLGGPFLSSLEYFYAVRRSHSRQIEAEHAEDKEWSTSSWILEQALSSTIIEDYIHGFFPLCHMDFHYKNILVDDDFNITGIIDWSDAQTVPVERFTISPEFVTFPGLSAKENEPIITFREKFAFSLRKREVGTRTGDGDRPEDTPSSSPRLISDLLGTPLWEVVYRCTYSFPWRARSDARLVLKQIFGEAAKWEDFVLYHTTGPIHHMHEAKWAVKMSIEEI